MSAYLFPTRLDRLVYILSCLDNVEWRSLRFCSSGGSNLRMGELRQAGLVISRQGRSGGHRLAFPFSRITLSHLLLTVSCDPCLTTHLFQRYGQTPIQELLDWPEAPRGKYRASLEAVVDIVSQLSTTQPIMPINIRGLPYCTGYIEQILASLSTLGLVTSIYRKGRMLTQPYSTLTIGDIAPVLAHRGHIHSAIILKSTNIKLVDIQY